MIYAQSDFRNLYSIFQKFYRAKVSDDLRFRAASARELVTIV